MKRYLITRSWIVFLCIGVSSHQVFGQWSPGGIESGAHQSPCVSDADQARIDAAIERYIRDGGPALNAARSQAAPKYSFYPMGGNLWQDLFTVNFDDLDNAGGVLDFDCFGWTYNGHDATDTGIRTFGEQAIGVPVFAALDGTVIDAHDGEFDMNTVWLGQPANFCVIDHGDGRIVAYYHFKNGSVEVQPGQLVVAGEQIGLTGSSGNSTGPHLHFASRQNGPRIEPYAGACNPIESGWCDQTPAQRDFYVWDFAFSPVALDTVPLPPHDLPRTGHFELGASDRKFWFFVGGTMLQNSVLDVRTYRPNGSLAASYNWSLTNSEHRGGWYWNSIPFHSDLNSITGTWRMEMDVNGQNVVNAPFEMLAAPDAAFNRPPEPVTISIDPPAPIRDEVVFCRVGTPRVLDDLDYDIVRYEYVWTVDGNEVRRIISAGQADAIARTHTQPGAVIECSVTPMDDDVSGITVNTQVIVDEFATNCNLDDTPDDCQLTNNDCNENLRPDDCDEDDLIVAHPLPQNACPGDSRIFGISASGAESFQWKLDGVDLIDGAAISGANTDTLAVSNIGELFQGTYTCETTEGCIVATSESAMLNVFDPVGITSQPISSDSACTGETTVISVGAVGDGITYQWFKDGNSLANSGSITGADSPNLSISNLSQEDEASSPGYVCLVSDNCGNSVLTQPSVLAIVGPEFSAQPESLCIDSGQSAVFSVGVSPPAGASLFVQWHKDGSPLVPTANLGGVFTDTLTINTAGAGDVGDYSLRVLVIGPNCVEFSAAAALQVDECNCLIPGDFDNDGDFDLADAQQFQSCFGADTIAQPECECANADGGNSTIDLADWASLTSQLE